MTTLTSGARLGPYEIQAPLGAGGMGEVYRARDTRLDRHVAIKVLPETLAIDPDALARFEREAKAVAALSHPNILSIFDFGSSAGGDSSLSPRRIVYAATELLEGATLRHRLESGPLPSRKAIDMAVQIAHGLAAAHEKGIVHRDLKPENVFVTQDGRVKILDFGLAKPVSPVQAADVTGAPTIPEGTTPGMVVGTVGYMSPEQVRGGAVDQRTDIFAFGAVLYEMLSGRRAFRRDTAADTMSAILNADPPELTTAAAGVPPALDRIVRRCLEKNPAERFHSAHDLALALETLSLTTDSSLASTSRAARPSRRSIAAALPWAVAGLAVAAATAIWIARPPADTAAAPVRKFHVPAKRLVINRGTRPVLSPDGGKLVFVAGDSLWIQALDQLEPRPLTTSWRPTNLFWSPDSAFVAFVSENRIWKVAVSGGQPIALAEVPTLGGGAGGAWRPDGKILYTRSVSNNGMFEVSQDGGEMKQIVPLQPGDLDFHDPSLLSDGNAYLIVVHRKDGADNITVVSGQTRKQVLQLKGETLFFPQYSASGHIVFGRAGKSDGVWAVPFDVARREVTGEPFLVATGGLWPSISADGTLTFIRRAWSEPRQLAIVSRAGKLERTVGEPQPGLGTPVLSPDGRRVAASIGEPPNRRDIWIYDVERGGRSRLTFVERNIAPAAWTARGSLIFDMPDGAERAIFEQPADGTGQAQKRFPVGWAASVSPDERFTVFVQVHEVKETEADLYYAQSGDREPRVFLEQRRSQTAPQLSPDGRYVAYQSNESGRYEIYVRPFPSGAGQWQVSFGGGGEARWSSRGDRLWFRAFGNALMEVDVQTTPAFSVSQPRELFKADPITVDLTAGYQVFGTGDRFAVVRTLPDPDGSIPSITVVQNWFAEFRGKR